MIGFLNKNIFISAIITLCYYLLVVLTHQQVGRIVAQNLDKPLGRSTYNMLILGIGMSLLLIYLVPFIKGLRNKTKSFKKLTWAYLLLIIFLTVVSINTIVVINVEIIHILQYCVLAILLFSILGRYTTTLFWGTILGSIDEAYQYLVLFPTKSNYFDFNDVILDFLGVSLGLVLLRAIGVSEKTEVKTFYKSSIIIASIIISISLVLGYYFQLISINPDDILDKEPLFSFIKKEHDPGFWKYVAPRPHTRFHIVRPLEFLCIILPLFFVFSKLNLGLQRSK